MIDVSNASRVVFPEVGVTKGDVVRFYERVGVRALLHLKDRPVSIRRFPKGLSGAGFFQKNVPAHYPDDIGRFAIPRSKAASKKHRKKGEDAAEETVYPLVSTPSHLAYLANQGAIELHVPTSRVTHLHRPDRLVVDLDPPEGAFALVRSAARLIRLALDEFGLACVPVATGSKGYHLVAPIQPLVEVDELVPTMQKFAELAASRHPDQLTTVFRVALRGDRVFVDWMRAGASATVVSPYSLRARPRATVATPLAWDEVDTTDPDRFTLADLDQLLDRSDPLADLAANAPGDPRPFVAAVNAAYERAGLVLETFDRFRS